MQTKGFDPENTQKRPFGGQNDPKMTQNRRFWVKTRSKWTGTAVFCIEIGIQLLYTL